jgi:nucleotide-binding universal stress UspA family protein
MTIRSVIVPLDESPLAEAALPYAEVLARAFGARLHLLGVVERREGGVLGVRPEVRAHVETVARQALTTYLEATAQELGGRGLDVDVQVRSGDPAQEIVAAAEELPDAVIAMATHGRGGMERWLIGSVADRVMRTASCPVLLVRPPQAGAERREVTLRRLMVPLDGSELAQTALPLAADLARALGVTLVLVRVEPWLTMTAPSYAFLPDLDRLEAEVEAAAAASLREARGQLPAALSVETVVLRGAPAATLIDYARGEGHIDLVVMSTHGEGGLRRLLIGSVADRIVRAGLPTLLIRPHAIGGSWEGAAT